jgi:hypothetical protein
MWVIFSPAGRKMTHKEEEKGNESKELPSLN